MVQENCRTIWHTVCARQKIIKLSFCPIDSHGVLKKAPDKYDLLERLASIQDKWHEIGLALRVDSSVLNGARNEQNDINKLFKIIENWIATTDSSLITWETIIIAVEGPIVSNKTKAKEIFDYLIKSK